MATQDSAVPSRSPRMAIRYWADHQGRGWMMSSSANTITTAVDPLSTAMTCSSIPCTHPVMMLPHSPGPPKSAHCCGRVSSGIGSHGADSNMQAAAYGIV